MRTDLVWALGLFVAVIVTAAIVNALAPGQRVRVRRIVILFGVYALCLASHYAFDAAGHHKLVEAGLFATRYGGTTVMVGAPAGDQTISISPAALLLVTEKRLMGTLYGTGNPAKSIHTLLALWRRGALDLESMVSYRRPLDEINEGFDDLRAGRGIRTMLTM